MVGCSKAMAHQRPPRRPTMLSISTVRKPKRRSSGLVAGLIATLPGEQQQHEQSGPDRGPAEADLEHQRQQERHRADHHPVDRSADVAHSERRHPQRVEAQQRVRSPAQPPGAGRSEAGRARRRLTSTDPTPTKRRPGQLECRSADCASDPPQSTKPTQSSGAHRPARSRARSARRPRTRCTPSGMLIKKIQCQLATVTIQPPSVGATPGRAAPAR